MRPSAAASSRLPLPGEENEKAEEERSSRSPEGDDTLTGCRASLHRSRSQFARALGACQMGNAGGSPLTQAAIARNLGCPMLLGASKALAFKKAFFVARASLR